MKNKEKDIHQLKNESKEKKKVEEKRKQKMEEEIAYNLINLRKKKVKERNI